MWSCLIPWTEVFSKGRFCVLPLLAIKRGNGALALSTLFQVQEFSRCHGVYDSGQHKWLTVIPFAWEHLFSEILQPVLGHFLHIRTFYMTYRFRNGELYVWIMLERWQWWQYLFQRADLILQLLDRKESNWRKWCFAMSRANARCWTVHRYRQFRVAWSTKLKTAW